MLQRITVCLLLTMALLLPPDVHAGTVQLPATGQALCYDSNGNVISCTGTGQDGAIRAGKAWPTLRFTDNGNGTVTDNMTGLIWLKNANCFGVQDWMTALASANTLASGSCGLTDSSTAGQWRLPNRKELLSPIDRSVANPALPTGHPFTGVQSNYYWSSSSYASGTNYAWIVSLDVSGVSGDAKANGYYVWPVRAGQ